MADIKQYLDFTEETLRQHKQMKLYLKTLAKRKENLEKEISNLRAVTYDGVSVQTSNTSSPVEDEVIKRYERMLDVVSETDKTEALVKKVDTAIANLDDIHRKVLTMYVVEGMDWISIEDKLPYSERQLRKKKDEAVKSVAIALFGATVLKEKDSDTLFDLL
ncbi:hypothetical protein [Peptacetobacter sp. AB845]|uniref:hypothetical protein n=1 Tax=Peptacetobacter sp. AB845 TaxID=3388429 RepID=UPI0039C99876